MVNNSLPLLHHWHHMHFAWTGCLTGFMHWQSSQRLTTATSQECPTQTDYNSNCIFQIVETISYEHCMKHKLRGCVKVSHCLVSSLLHPYTAHVHMYTDLCRCNLTVTWLSWTAQRLTTAHRYGSRENNCCLFELSGFELFSLVQTRLTTNKTNTIQKKHLKTLATPLKTCQNLLRH